jgi:hypothetical protein
MEIRLTISKVDFVGHEVKRPIDFASAKLIYFYAVGII